MNTTIDRGALMLMARTKCIDRIKAASFLFEDQDKWVIDEILAKYAALVEEYEMETFTCYGYDGREWGSVTSGIKIGLKTTLDFDKNGKYHKQQLKIIHEIVDSTTFPKELIEEKIFSNRVEKGTWGESKHGDISRKLSSEAQDYLNLELIRIAINQNQELINKYHSYGTNK